MLNQSQIDEAVQRLLDAGEARQQTDQITEAFPEMTDDDAYAIQLALVQRRLTRGHVLVGKKVALTNRAIQQNLGVNEPVFGHLMSDMFVQDGAPISCGELLQPKVEPEIAFLLKEELKGPGITAARVLAATAGVMPALEIPGTRIRDWKLKLGDIVADNAAASRVVLGGKLTPVEGLDLRLLGVVLEKNGVLVSTGAGAAALGNPVDSVAWLANKLARYGLSLRAGDVVIPGALVLPPEAHPGDFFRATFDRLGSVSAVFVE
jgi:2-keto-4-pentenoate hydratase